MTTCIAPRRSLQARIVRGSIVLLSGSGLTTATNLAYNIAVARFLGPQGYGHATVVYTLLTLLSAVTLTFQIVSTKVIAQQSSPNAKSTVYRPLHRAAWACGIVVALGLLLFRRSIAHYLNLPDALLIALLAIGAAFYVPLGSRRGYIQGTYGFRGLAANLVLEGAGRLGGAVALVSLGWGVRGVIVANVAAIAVAYFAIAPRLEHSDLNALRLDHVIPEMGQALAFFAGQVLINNCDIILVKHFFPAYAAGLYAAVAMIGRVIFAFSNAVVNTTFPLVAGTREEERKDLSVIATSLLLVLACGGIILLGSWLAPAGLWSFLFGPGFALSGRYDVPFLFTLYALSAIFYSLSAVFITFEMSYKITNTSWVQLGFSGVLVAAICVFHETLRQVILVQLTLMAILFVLVAVPALINLLSDPKDVRKPGDPRRIRLIRQVSEDAVISEFLRSDFNGPAFHEYKETLHDLVMNPNFENESENAKRRALFFIRHLALWRELPQGTDWYEVEVDPKDLGNIRMFPRAQWRRVADGRFAATDVAGEMRRRDKALDPAFLSKIEAIGNRFNEQEDGFGAVLLIGVSESEPLTVLDGNHRLVAAMLHSPDSLQKLRFFCGLSPRMTECCWYKTNLMTLFRYAKNVIAHSTRSPAAELAKLLQNPG